MFTLALIVCLQGEPLCFSFTPQTIFKTEEQCEAGYAIMIERQTEAVAKGQLKPFANTYKCINWGVPA